MKRTDIQKKLIRNGYTFTIVIGTGNIVAKKGQRTYVAHTFNEMHSKLFSK